MANENDTGPKEPIPEWIRWFREHSVPIAGLLTVLLLICLIQHYSTRTINWTKTKDFTDAFRNVTQGLAIVAGGVWAYFKFVKGRTFQERVIPAVSGKFAVIDDSVYLVVTTRVKNVGLSKIQFSHIGSALIVSEYAPTTLTEIHAVRNKRLTSFDLFDEKGRSIEPNEIIQEQMLIALPGAVQLAYRLELVIRSPSEATWRATAIVDKSTLQDNTGLEHALGFQGAYDDGD